jgi:3-hydroxymyristoyl/3-hydroxydecanoyl-(acyl carrier protein) dehydratase
MQIAYGRKDDFSKFRTFGCRIWARPTDRRSAKFTTNLRKGIFLGFLPNTTKLIMYYNVNTKRVKKALHVRFDEGMDDLPSDSIPPNVVHLQQTQDGDPISPDTITTSIDDFNFYTYPFANVINTVINISCNHPTFGLEFDQDSVIGRTYISGINAKTSAASLFLSLQSTRRKLIGSFILSIDDTPMFDTDDIMKKILEIQASNAASFSIIFATEQMLSTKDHEQGMAEFYKFAPGTLATDKSVKAIQSIDPEFLDFFHEMEIDYDSLRAITALRFDMDTSKESIPTEMINIVINAIGSSAITPEE